MALFDTIATKIAGAIDIAHLAEQAQLVPVDAERQRLARELHNSVTQSLYSVILLNSGWQNMAKQGTLTDPAAALQQLGEVGLGALREMRLLIHQPRPPILEEIGPVRALQQRLDIVELRANINLLFRTRGNVDYLLHKLEDQLFQIAQEALNNALRHAQADAVIVMLEREDDRVTLTVTDDGQGFDPTEHTTGMGMTSMRERAESLQGTMEIATRPNCDSTTVRVTIPLQKAGV